MQLLKSKKVDEISFLFKEKYKCEKLRFSDSNKDLIKDFSGGERGKGVEKFLKESAWKYSEEGRTEVYLVKESRTGNIRAYFSIKCGILYSPYPSEILKGEDRDFFNLILDAMRNKEMEALKDYKASGLYSDEKFEQMYREAQRISDEENERISGKNSYNVDVTYPAVEIENLCKNFAFESDDCNSKNNEKIPFGFLVFWIYIIPMIKELSQIVGCEYIYIFAADQSDDESLNDGGMSKASLISYYKANFGFHDADDIRFVRPSYDEKCYEMIQSVKEAVENSKNIWEQFDDILNNTDSIESIIP